MLNVFRLSLLVLLFPLLVAGNCSRARVESIQAMNDGVGLAIQQRYPEAVVQLEKAASIDGTNEQVYYNLALVHLEMKKFALAKEDLNRAISINPEKVGYQDKLGTVMMQMAKKKEEESNHRERATAEWTEAKAAFSAVVAKDPKMFKTYFKLAQASEALDDPQSALNYYTKSIQSGPRFIEAYTNLGALYADLGFLNEASQVINAGLQVVVKGGSDEAMLRYLLGTIFQQKKEYQAALKEFKATLKILPSMQDALFSAGWAESKVGDKEEACRYLKKFTSVGAGQAPTHYLKAARDKMDELNCGDA